MQTCRADQIIRKQTFVCGKEIEHRLFKDGHLLMRTPKLSSYLLCCIVFPIGHFFKDKKATVKQEHWEEVEV